MKLSNYKVGQFGARRSDEIYFDMLSDEAQAAILASNTVDGNIITNVFPIAYVAVNTASMHQQAIDDEAMVQSGVYGLAC